VHGTVSSLGWIISPVHATGLSPTQNKVVGILFGSVPAQFYSGSSLVKEKNIKNQKIYFENLCFSRVFLSILLNIDLYFYTIKILSSGAGTSNNSRRTGNMSFGGSGTGGASSSSNGRATIPPSTITKPIFPTHTTEPTTGFCCFNWGEPGHRFAECKKGPRRELFLDVEENIREQEGDVETELVYDEEERLEGDHGPLLMIHRKCVGYCPREGVDIKPGTTFSSTKII
jgi:hypothetical protein